MRINFSFIILLAVFLIFGSEISFADKNTSATDYKWIKIITSIPEDMVFDHNIVVEIKNEKTGKLKSYTIEETDSYIGYYEIDPGTYSISSAKVVGEYEGVFKCGYPKESFKIDSSVDRYKEIPIIIDYYVHSSYEDNEDTADYSNMSFDEAMAEINKNPPDVTTDSDEAGYSEADDFIEEAIAEEDEKMSKEENYEIKKEEAAAVKSNQKNRRSIFLSIGITVMLLGGLAISFYMLKRKRDNG